MIVRLAVSACAAFLLVALTIALGSWLFDGGPPPESWAPELPLALADPALGAADLDALRAFLGISPTVRLERALERRDRRYLGLEGHPRRVPGVADGVALAPARILVIPGTTDTPISDEHDQLVTRAHRYAKLYNALLERRETGSPGPAR